MTRFLSLLISISLLTGCLAKSLGDNSDSKIVLTDASKRAITVVAVDTPNRKSTQTGSSNSSDQDRPLSQQDGRRVIPHRIVCAEPSPDIANAVQTAVQASLKGKGNVKEDITAELEGQFSRSVTESIAQLGSRLATIQLLRDELSDLCRAYANGAVSSITYTLRLSRLDKKMITLLVSEASAGALSRALVGINGTASSGVVAPERLEAAETHIKEAARAVGEAGAALDGATRKQSEAKDKDEAAKQAAKIEVDKAEVLLREKLDELSARVLQKWALETRGSGLLAASTASAIAGLPSQSGSSLDLRAIHKAYLDDDDLGTLLDACLTSMEDNAATPNLADAEDLKALKQKLDDSELDYQSAQSEFNGLNSQLLQTKVEERSADLNEAVRKASRKAEVAGTRYRQLQQDYEEKSGSSDRTGLLNFCRRNGMFTITRLIEKKITDRFYSESNRSFVDMCKTAVSSSTVDSKAKGECMSQLLSRPPMAYPAYPSYPTYTPSSTFSPQ